MITKEKKQTVINELNKESLDSKSLIFLNFHEASVAKTFVLRRELRKKDASYKVARKTLIKKAFQNSGFEGDFTDFKGEMAVLFLYQDNIADILKFILGFQKEGKFKLMGGIFENTYRTADFMFAISEIPSKEVLYYQLVNTINAPLKQMVDVLNGGIVNLINVLNQIAKKQ